MDVTEAEDIEKRWQEYIEGLYEADLNDSDNHNGVITHLEPDILECKVKRVLASLWTKLVEVMEFQWSYFKSWKMRLWKCCTQYASKFGKLSSGHRTGKVPPFIPIPKKGNAKECLNYHTIALISHASKVMLKIRQAKFNSIWTKHFQMFKLDLEKAREPEIKLSTSVGSQKKQENSRKTSTIASLTRLSLWLCGSKQTGKFLKRWDYQTTWPASWEICMQVKRQQLELDMEQQTGSKLGKE